MKVEVWSGNEVFRPLNIMLEVLEANRGDGRIASIVIPVYKDAITIKGLSAEDALFLAMRRAGFLKARRWIENSDSEYEEIMNAQSMMEGL